MDVVIGYVEPHARPETTAQIGELEIVPPIVTQYKGVELREMDTAAVIARAPTVALVDELAHTNAPGAKTKKRFEDVEDLLAAGINVISTLNIQHLEGLYNVVEGATGVRVKERIPAEFLTRADQIGGSVGGRSYPRRRGPGGRGVEQRRSRPGSNFAKGRALGIATQRPVVRRLRAHARGSAAGHHGRGPAGYR